MRTIFIFHLIVRDKVTVKTVSTDYNLLKSLERSRAAEAESNRGPSAHQPQALPLGQTGSPMLHHRRFSITILSSLVSDE